VICNGNLNGEPVVVTILMRNVTDEPQAYFRPIHAVATKDGKLLKRKDDTGFKQITMSPGTTLFPQTQHKYQEHLDQIYDLKQTGQYIFQAGRQRPEVTSQYVSILITNAVQAK
jgi:hypothetical protein